METNFVKVQCYGGNLPRSLSELRVGGRLVGYETVAISSIPEVGDYSVFCDTAGKRVSRLDGFGTDDAVRVLANA